MGHGHDDFAKDSFHMENSDDKNLPLHLPQDHKEVKSKPNEDVGIKEENISRKIEINYANTIFCLVMPHSISFHLYLDFISKIVLI